MIFQKDLNGFGVGFRDWQVTVCFIFRQWCIVKWRIFYVIYNLHFVYKFLGYTLLDNF